MFVVCHRIPPSSSLSPCVVRASDQLRTFGGHSALSIGSWNYGPVPLGMTARRTTDYPAKPGWIPISNIFPLPEDLRRRFWGLFESDWY